MVKIILNFIQIKVRVMAERQIILSNMEALVGADLSKAFKAVRGEKVRNVFEKFHSFLIVRKEHILTVFFLLSNEMFILKNLLFVLFLCLAITLKLFQVLRKIS